jgi:hypothetical protein
VWSDPIVWRCTADISSTLDASPWNSSGSLIHKPYNAKKMAAMEVDIVLV